MLIRNRSASAKWQKTDAGPIGPSDSARSPKGAFKASANGDAHGYDRGPRRPLSRRRLRGEYRTQTPLSTWPFKAIGQAGCIRCRTMSTGLETFEGSRRSRHPFELEEPDLLREWYFGERQMSQQMIADMVPRVTRPAGGLVASEGRISTA